MSEEQKRLEAARNFLFANQFSRSPAEDQNARFLSDFHNRVLARGRELNQNGQVTTMRLGSVGADGNTFLIPTFDPRTRSVTPFSQAFQNMLPHIRSGQLIPFSSVDAAEDFRRRVYPQILRASLMAQLLHPSHNDFSRIVSSLQGGAR